MIKDCHNCGKLKTCELKLQVYSFTSLDDCWIENDELKTRRLARNAKARARRADYADAMKSCGMVRGKDSRGRTIWE